MLQFRRGPLRILAEQQVVQLGRQRQRVRPVEALIIERCYRLDDVLGGGSYVLPGFERVGLS